MKAALPLSVFLSLALVLPAQAAMWQSMLVHYGFDEVTGITALNSMSGGMDATLVGDAMRSNDIPPTGIANHTSLQLSGNGYLSTGHFALDNRSFSVATWLKTTDMTTAQVIASQGVYGKKGRNLVLSVNPSGSLTFSFTGDDTTTADGVLTKGDWHHVAFTFDASTRQRRIYVDGTMDASATSSGVLMGQTGLMQIGRLNADPFGASFWNGNIDDFSVFNTVLSGDDVMTLATVSTDVRSSSSSSRMSRSSMHSSSSSVRPYYEQVKLSDRVKMRLILRTRVPQMSSVSSSSASSVSSMWSSTSMMSSMQNSSSSMSSVMNPSMSGNLYQVISTQLHLRKDSRATAVNIRTLMPHTQLVVEKMLKNGWAKVHTADDGTEGYVNASFIEKVQ